MCLIWNAATYQEEQILNCNMSDTEDGETGVKQEKDDVAMVKELPSCNSLVYTQYGMHFTSVGVFDAFLICVS